MKKIRLNLLKAAESFEKNRAKLTHKMATTDDDTIEQQVAKILETKDTDKIFLLVQFLNACCRHSMRRYNLFKFRLGAVIVEKLENEGFHICNCTNWRKVGNKKTEEKNRIIHAVQSRSNSSGNSRRLTRCGINAFWATTYKPLITCKRCLKSLNKKCG